MGFRKKSISDVLRSNCIGLVCSFSLKKNQSIYYENIKVGVRRADFVVENQIIIELKAVIKLDDANLAQAKNYVKMYDFPLGLLINFGGVSLEYKLIFNPKYNKT